MSSLPITIPHPGLRKIAGFRKKSSTDWSAYPYNQAAHLPFRDPFSEFGQLSILGERFPDQATAFHLIDCNHDGYLRSSDFRSETDTLDVLLGGPQPPIRMLIFQRRGGCPAKSWQLSSEHLKKIFSRYHVQPCFVHRLKSYRFSAGPELYRSCTATEDESSDNVGSHDLQMSLNIPYTTHTIFCLCYFAFDATTKRQVLLMFNDTANADQSEEFVKYFESLLHYSFYSKLHLESLLFNPFTLPVMICGLVAEGWDKCTYDLEVVQSDMEKQVQHRPDDIAGDSEKLFGVLTFRMPGLIAFQETLDVLKEANAAFVSTHGAGGNQTLVVDLLNQQQGLLRSVKRDFDYMRNRLEDLNKLSFNIIAKQNSTIMAEIATHSFRDAISMRTVALVTLFFLPGTFIASFFSMSFFSASQSPFLSRPASSWLFFVLTLPLTTFTILIWEIWKQKEERRFLLGKDGDRITQSRSMGSQPKALQRSTRTKRTLFEKMQSLSASLPLTMEHSAKPTTPTLGQTRSDLGMGESKNKTNTSDLEKQVSGSYSKPFACKEDLEMVW